MEGEAFRLYVRYGRWWGRLLGDLAVDHTAWLRFGKGFKFEGPLVEGNSGRNPRSSGPLLRHFVCPWIEHPGYQRLVNESKRVTEFPIWEIR